MLSGSGRVRRLWLACIASIITWDDSGWDLLSAGHLDSARETGDLAELPLALEK
jgi:hypothetical protein